MMRTSPSSNGHLCQRSKAEVRSGLWLPRSLRAGVSLWYVPRPMAASFIHLFTRGHAWAQCLWKSEDLVRVESLLYVASRTGFKSSDLVESASMHGATSQAHSYCFFLTAHLTPHTHIQCAPRRCTPPSPTQGFMTPLTAP